MQHYLAVSPVKHNYFEGRMPLLGLGFEIPLYCGSGDYRVMSRQNDLG